MQIKALIGWRPDDIQSRPVAQQPAHSRYRKCDLYQIADQFNYIDQHAIQVNRCLYSAISLVRPETSEGIVLIGPN